MLDAGALSLVVRAGAGYNTIDVATASQRGIYVSNCPGQERHRGRRARVRADPRARPPHSRQRRRAARRDLEQEGVLEGARPVRPDARPARLRQHRPGAGAGARTRSGCRSSSGAAASPTGKEQRRGRADSDAAREVAGRGRRAQCDILSVHLALTPETTRPRQRRRPRQAEAGRVLHQHRARRSGRLRRAREGGPRARHPRRARRVRRRADRRHGRLQATRSPRCRTSTARITSAPRPTRRRKRSPPRPSGSSSSYKDTGQVPNVVNLAKKTPATHMLVVRHRDRPGVLAHVFEHLRERRDQRAGDRERHLRRRPGRRRAHQPRRRAGRRAAEADAATATATSSICIWSRFSR